MSSRKQRTFLEARAKSEGTKPHGCTDAETLKFWVQWPKKKKPTKFDFSFLRKHFGPTAFAAAEHLNQLWAMGSLPTARNRHGDLKSFFKSTQIVRAPSLSRDELDSAALQAWQSATDDWAGEIKAKYSKQRTAGQIIANVNRALGTLQRAQLFPLIDQPSIPKDARKTSSPRSTLGQQIKASGTPRATVADVIEELVRNIWNSEEKTACRAELFSLAAMLDDDLPTSPQGLLAAMKELQLKCLRTVENLASAKFLAWQAHYEEGQRLVQHAQPLIVEKFRNAFKGRASASRWLRGSVGFLTKEELVGSALRCIIDHLDGIAPTDTSTENRSIVQWLYRTTVGRREIDGYLYPTLEAVAAAMLLTACETGANPAVLCELSTDLGIKPHPDHPSAFVFESLKRRAGNTFIISLLQAHRDDGVLPSISALQILLLTLKPLREALKTDAFFVFRYFVEPSFATGQFLSSHLRYLLKDAGLASKYAFTPSAIRTCVLVLHSLSKSPDSLITRHLAGHAEDSTATSRYEFRFEQQVRLSAYARQYQEKVRQFSEAVATGRRPETAPSASGEEDFRYSQIVDLTEGLILDSVLTIRCLDRANDDLVQHRRTHWLQVCEPELAWATVLLEKAQKSPLAHRVPWAEREATKLMRDGFVHHLE